MSPTENRLLAALPPLDFARLTARTTEVTFEHRGNAYRSGGPLDFVYFPRTGVMSSVIIMLDGATARRRDGRGRGHRHRHGRVRLLDRVKLLDRVGLEAASCECYAAMRGAFDTLS